MCDEVTCNVKFETPVDNDREKCMAGQGVYDVIFFSEDSKKNLEWIDFSHKRIQGGINIVVKK